MIDKGNFIDNFNDECVSFIMSIGNNINVFINIENEDKNIRDFNNSFENKKIDFNNNLSDMIVGVFVGVFVGIGNNISIYIVEVPNETAPSIQGFAKPPA